MESITPIVVYRKSTTPDKERFPDSTIFVDDEGKGKKYALHKAISSATTEYVWLLDDDVFDARVCMERLLAKPPTDADLYIMPLCMTEGDRSLIERLQQAEYIAIQALTLITAEKGKAVMCSGANLLVRRKSWLESYDDLHLDIPSGDDMFLLESFKRRGLQIEPLLLTVSIKPISNLRQFLSQRMRWAGKAPYYKDRDIRSCGIMMATINILSVLCPPFWVLKFILELSLLRYASRHYPFISCNRMSFFISALLSLLYPWYMFVCLIGGICQRKRGKNIARF